ncbi:MAG: DUF2304 family protein [Planctomycetota bacterium]
MILFQVFGLMVCSIFGVGAVLSVLRGRIGPLVGLAWLTLWVTAGIAIARPEITVAAARLLGITRGADLVFYLAILGMIIGFFAVYLGLRRLEGEITSLVRNIAIQQAESEAENETAETAREAKGS